MREYSLHFSVVFFFLCFAGCICAYASTATDTGYELWLNYKPVQDHRLRQTYIRQCSLISLPDSQFDEVIADELKRSIQTLLAITPEFTDKVDKGIQMVYCTDKELGNEGYVIRSNKKQIILQAFSDAGFLYGTFHLIRLMQCGYSLEHLNIREIPALELRQLNHWDDLNGNIERGYAGKSLWKWEELPDKIDRRYVDYARANASVGINGVALNNVNADPRILRCDYLKKVAALARIFRKYNIRVYLTANFAAPLKPSTTPDVMKQWGGVGDLGTANPHDPLVQKWWKTKVDEIYSLIPDFGGFLVKANSEGMPGPQDYQCTHADGANLLARALKPHGGIVMWRTFVYNPAIDKDRMKRSYKEFLPLDGKFDDNVILQTKNGALDFQPSEPAQPLFGAMRQTPLMPELQITQEYTGHSTYLVYLLPMWREFFDSNIFSRPFRAMAGVANTGDAPNWTGHHFAQANWFAFGRLAWNPNEDSQQITFEWIKSTWNCDEQTARVIEQMMMPTWNSFVQSHSPYSLGLTTQIACHYEAGFDIRANKEWKISKESIGNNRTVSGSEYVSQYSEPNSSMFNDINRCPELYLLCFHDVPWNHRMKAGHTLREELVANLTSGMEQADQNLKLWKSIHDKIDVRRYEEVMKSLLKERKDAEAFYHSAHHFFSRFIDTNTQVKSK